MIFKFFNGLLIKLNNHGEQYGFPSVLFGLYEMLNYILDYPFSVLITQEFQDPTFKLHIISFFLCLLLAMKKIWPESLRKFYTLYFYIVVIWCLPFSISFFFFHNVANLNVIIINGMLAIFIMILMTDWLSYLIMLVLGVSLGWLSQKIIYGPITVQWGDIATEISTFLWTILVGIIFSRNASNYRANASLQNQLSTIRTVCASIAHELRTPLLAIKSGAAGIQHFLPRLLETYKIAQQHHLKIPEIREGHLNNMTQVMNNIESEVDFSNDVITSLLTNAMNNNLSLNPKLRYGIVSTVKAALLRYHFNPANQIEVVHFNESNNFEYHADEILVTHIIFNLLKNAIYAIEEIQKGEIFIRLAHEKNYNCLYFKDTAKGMSKETQSNLFQAFYTEKPNNTGIGLAFSKMVMDNLGGQIAVNSVLGEYAEFVLRFPIVKDSLKGS